MHVSSVAGLVRFIGLSILLLTKAAQAEPNVFWANDPVAPDDTVLVVGDQLVSAGDVQITRIPDDPENFVADVGTRFVVRPMQVGDSSLKFIVPKDLSAGAYRYYFTNAPIKSYELNTPSIYWQQGDLGSSSSAGGWLRLLGRNIVRNSEARLTLIADRGAITNLRPSSFNLWDAKFNLPSDFPTGIYRARLWNGNGDASAWRDAGDVSVVAKWQWPALTLNLKNFGASGDGIQDDTTSIKAALKALANQGGGTLFMPRGFYKLSEGIKIPNKTRIKGEDQTLVRLIWPEFEKPPMILLDGKSDFAIEDLTLVAYNHGHIVSGGYEPDSNTINSDAKNIAIRRITIRASMYRGHLSPEQSDLRFRTALNFSTGGPDTVRLSGKNLVIEDSDLYGSGRSLYLNRAHGGYIARNKLYNGRLGWYSITGSDAIIFEGNRVIGADLQSSGGGINTLFNVKAFAQNVAFLRNQFELMHGWDREAMTSDGPGGCYYGLLGSISDDHQTVILPLLTSAIPLDLTPCIGAGLFIMGGKGMGQVRRIANVEGNVIKLEKPFSVAPDLNSVLSVTTFQRRYLIIGNQFTDAGVAVQFFGSSIEHVVADNVSTRTGGFLNHGLNYYAYQPSWYNQFLNNQIVEGDMQREAYIATWGSQKSPNTAPLSLGTIIRGNRLDGAAHIELRGYNKATPGVQDVITEANEVSRSSVGISIDQGVRKALVRKNIFRDVVTPVINLSEEPLQ